MVESSPTQWTWVWVNSGRWWRTGKPGVLHSMGMQRVRHNLATKQLINYLQNHSLSVRVYIYNIHVHECVCMWVAVKEQWFSCCWGRGIPSPDIWQCLEGLFYCYNWVICDNNNSIQWVEARHVAKHSTMCKTDSAQKRVLNTKYQ